MTNMPIKKQLGDLQLVTKEAQRSGGNAPDTEPRFGPLIADAWYADYLADGKDDKEMAIVGTILRASDSGGCARALSYKVRRRLAKLAGEEADGLSNPPTVADTWRLGLGSMIHTVIEGILPSAFPGAEHEVKVLSSKLDNLLSMHVDVLITIGKDHPTYPPGYKIVIEIKSINGFGFKKAVGLARIGDVPEGPKMNAVLQGALAADELDADEMVVLNMSLELISVGIAEKRGLTEYGRFIAEWTFTPEEFKPLAERERARMKAVVKVVESGKLAPRAIADPEIPKGARITNPAKGEWHLTDEAGNRILNIGNTWWCDYCWDRDRCISDGPT